MQQAANDMAESASARLDIDKATKAYAIRTSDHDASIVHQQLAIAHLNASESYLRFTTRTLVMTAPPHHRLAHHA